MKKSTIRELVMAGIVLSSFAISAQSDTQYPAANYQPKVIFTDESVAAANKTAKEPAHAVSVAQTDSQYPAANYQPKVIFIDESAAKSSHSSGGAAPNVGKKTAFDPKYPAASFEPKIVYPSSAG